MCRGLTRRLDGPLSARLHAAIGRGLVRSCHDLSEGGLAVALAEMAIAGGLGATVTLAGRAARGSSRPRLRAAVLGINQSVYHRGAARAPCRAGSSSWAACRSASWEK